MKVILIVTGAHVPVCSSAIWCRAQPYKTVPNLDFLSQTAGWWDWNSSKSRSSKAALKSNDPNLTRGFKNMLSGAFRREKFGATLMAWQQLLKLWILLLFNWNQEIERKQKLCSFWILISFHWVEVSKPSYLHFFKIKCVRKRWFVWKGGTLLTKSWFEFLEAKNY